MFQHHSAQRPKMARAGEEVRVEPHGEVAEQPPPQPQLFSLFGEEPGGSRPPCLGEPRRPQERIQPHTMEQLADVVPVVQVLDFPVVQEGGGALEGDRMVALLKHLDKPIPLQAIVVRKKSKLSRRCFVPEFRFVPMEHQTAEQLVEVPTAVSFSSLQRTAEQSVDIPVSGRRPGGGGGLQGLRPGQDSTAFGGAEHVDIPVPQKSWRREEVFTVFAQDKVHQLLHQWIALTLLRRLLIGFFALFPE